MLPGGRVEHEDRAFEPAKPVVAAVGRWDVSQAEVDKEGFAGVVETPVGEDIADVVVTEVALGEAPFSEDFGGTTIKWNAPL